MNHVIKKFVIPGGMVAALVTTSVVQAENFDRARVTDVQPVYESVEHRVPVEQCHQERVSDRHVGRAAPPILGAIIGGAIGNAVGHKKRNKQVGTLIGAILGGTIGADIGRRRNDRHHEDRDDRGWHYRIEEICDTSYESRYENRLSGYNVRYEYAGTTYQTRMDRDPGEYIRVRVRVRPV